MHEHGLADEILHALLQHRDRLQAHRVVSATVQISELSGLTQEALQSALDHCCEHENLQPIALAVEVPGLIAHCRSCDRLVCLSDALHCGECGGSDIRLCGDEAVIVKECRCE